ncbi:helix-turn-helix transcriptional regulator [Paenibacillus sp. SC116]|uniref:helix-turn-helix domain-containing protein n=1 Tax=Paenibacillus sp. SC116 TaxID=2968986 RepID=UPI00215AA660|nr:helix-turn-helix transcriptional regulator [Paenibacillus sp. SC116]MCR8843131.1 helix-turn-helix transcriptional regulator [Paenibacillus sp. SC116]
MDIVIERCHLYDIIYSRGLTPQQFAEKVGTSKSQLSEYNSGNVKLGMKNALMYSHVLKCSVNDFYTYRVITDS